MSDWVPLDEKELLQEDIETKAYHDNTSPQDQGPRGSLGFADLTSYTDAAPAGPRREVTREIILRALDKQGARRRSPSRLNDPHAEERLLAAQSHLHLNGRNITHIANLRPLTTLEVLYLYDNQITVIENLSHLRRLTHLYLANNAIRGISGLAGLSSLQKLYLENNCIQVVSGLEACPSLEELHISSQRLPPGTPLAFDPTSIAALAGSLRVLSAAHCGILSASLPQLAGLRRLRRLDLSYNAIDAFEPLDAVVQPCPSLSYLDLRGNPVTRLAKYRDTLILMNDNVTTLDDEAIPAQHREFLLRLHIRRMKAQLAAELKEDGGLPQQQQGSGSGSGQAASGGAPGRGPGGAGREEHAVGGVAGSSRVPPRTGGFHQTAPSAGGVSGGGTRRGVR